MESFIFEIQYEYKWCKIEILDDFQTLYFFFTESFR